MTQTHFRKTEVTRNHPHQNVLVTWTKVKTLYTQQTAHVPVHEAEITPTFRKVTVGSPKQVVGCGPFR
jgi:hypothetical protein